MCSIIALRNRLIALGVLIGWAVSSAWFAYAWSGYPIVSAVSYGVVMTAALAALVAIGFVITAAVSFCTCVAGVSSCGTACSSITPALYAVIVVLMVLFLAGVRGVGGANDQTQFLMIAGCTAALAVMTAYVTSLFVQLTTCQTRG